MIRILVAVVLIGLGVCTTLIWQSATNCTLVTPDTPQPVETMTTRWVEGIGYVEPKSELRRLTFQISGVITHCGPKPGERVRGGALIAELDGTTLKATATVARRKLDHARAKLIDLKTGEHPQLIVICELAVGRLREQARYLRAEANRREQPAVRVAASDTERNEVATRASQADIALREKQAELQYLNTKVRAEQIAVAEAEVRQAEAAVAEAEQRLVDIRLVAPFDGVVLKYLKREGEGVSPLTPPEPVVLFGDLSKLRVRAEIDERYVRLLSVGQTAEVHGRNVEGQSYRGRVVEVERVMGDKTVFSRAAWERKDLHVLQVLVEMDNDFNAPVGLQVDVRVLRK